MKRSSLGICSASTVSYEYCCTGGILFIYKTVSNQKKIYEFLIKTGLAFPAVHINKKNSLLSSKTGQQKYFDQRKQYFSGTSSKNLQNIFSKIEAEREITLRKASIEDLITYFKWANDPLVRLNSVKTSDITFENHTKWFRNKLKSKSSLLFVIEKSGYPIGQVRFDKDDDYWEIDYSIDKRYRGKGFGEIILRNAIIEFRKKHTNKILGKVKDINLPSCKVFESLNFIKSKSIKIEKTTYNTYLLGSG